MKRHAKIAIFIIIIFILLIVYTLPRKHHVNDFKNLNYGDNFIFTMLKLGIPTNIYEGGNGTLHFQYKLDDGSSVYLTFGWDLFILRTCTRIKHNETLDIYVEPNKIQEPFIDISH